MSRNPPQDLDDALKEMKFRSPGSGSSNRNHSSSFCSNKNWRFLIAEQETFCAGYEVWWLEHPQCGTWSHPAHAAGHQWHFGLYARHFAPGAQIKDEGNSAEYNSQGRAPHCWLSQERVGGPKKPMSRIIGGAGIDHLDLCWQRSTGSFDQAFLEHLLVAADLLAETQDIDRTVKFIEPLYRIAEQLGLTWEAMR